MPIVSPQLDDLRYQVLIDQLRLRIPLVTPEWTDHNDSDPGITLLQLFSHLAEQIGYRLNRLPDKVFIEMLKLIGVRLRPAEAARTSLAFYLTKAELAEMVTVPAGTRVKAKAKVSPPPPFETVAPFDLIPAQAVALVTTRSSNLRDINDGGAVDGSTQAGDFIPPRYSLAWDGRMPKLKDWPTQPVPLFARPAERTHDCLWLGLAFNRNATAGFVGQRVALTVQLDDDELPDPMAVGDCAADLGAVLDAAGPPVDYVYYRPPQAGETIGSWKPLAVLSDSTAGWSRSGVIRLDVPTAIGPIPDGEWREVRPPQTLTTQQLCETVAGTAPAAPPPIAHPLVGALKTPVQGTPTKVPVSGWIGVLFRSPAAALALRALSFNAVGAIGATTVESELLGRGSGQSNQIAKLANGNVLAESLEVVVEDPVDRQYHEWKPVGDFDTAGRDDRVYVLDPEAGWIYFGDGVRGAVPALGTRMVAVRYRHGGGAAAELPAGTVTQGEGLPAAVQDVTNPIAARGGKDAETLDQARARAPRELKTLGRAVTADDFDLLARQTVGASIVRTAVVPLRRPYQAEGIARPGIDVERVAPGALSVVVVPGGTDERFRVPTETVLRTVCKHLDRYRLVTTELYVVPPMYVRLFDLEVRVVPKPGWSRAQLRDSIAATLEQHFSVWRSDGTGFPFGGTLHHSELVALVFRADGVERVESLNARYDGNAPAPPGEDPPMRWREERWEPRDLLACPDGPEQLIALFPDETVVADTSSLNVIVLV